MGLIERLTDDAGQQFTFDDIKKYFYVYIGSKRLYDAQKQYKDKSPPKQHCGAAMYMIATTRLES